MENGVTGERLRQLEAFREKSEADRKELWHRAGQADTRLAVQDKRLDSLVEDLAKQGSEVSWIRRGMWTAAGFAFTSTVAIVALILSGAS